MKTLFLEIDTARDWAVASIGPASLAAVLRDSGHRAELLRVAVDREAEELADEVAAAAPDLLALSLTSRQWLRARRLVGALRRRLDLPVVAGGLHPTFSPEAVLASPGFDYVCLGEGEEALLELVERLAAGRSALAPPIDNIWARGGPRPRLRPPVASLDDLPFLARDLLDEPPGVVHMATQRGCPFPCTYCAARGFDRLYEGVAAYGRRRSHADVLAELAELDAAGRLSYVIFLDDTFTLHHRWVGEFCRLYGERFRAPFSLHARVDSVDDELLETLAAAGCRHITYGVESGSDRVRREVMRRPVPQELFHRVFRKSRELGILATANYMLGLPGETRAELEETYRLAAALEADDFGYFVFYPYPGTELFELCRERGYLPDDYLRLPANHRRSILRLPELTADEISAVYDRFTELREHLFRRRYAGGVGEVEEIRRLAATG